MKNDGKSKAKESMVQALRKILTEKPFSKISIEEIVSRANVSRQSFYRNFYDKYDLLAYLYKCDIDNLRTKYSDTDITNLSVEVITYFKENSFIYRDLGCDFGSPNPFMDFWLAYCQEHLVSGIGRKKITPEVAYALQFFLHTCYYIHYEYMANRIKGTPEEVSMIITKNIPEILKPFFH